MPAHWRSIRLAYLFDEVRRPVAVDPNATYQEIGICSHGRGVFHKAPLLGAALEDKNVFWLQPGLLVFNIVFAWEGAVAVTAVSERGMIASHRFPTFAARCSHADVQYFRYFFMTNAGLTLLDRNSPGAAGRNRTLDRWALFKEKVFLPPLEEQRAIVAFLDRETSRIDALVEKKQQLIGLLREKRAVVITRAVTRGLDSEVSLKDSGVGWLGRVPEHWDVCRTKFVARLESGHTPSRQHPEYWVGCTIPWFSLSDVWQIRDGRTEYVYETAEKVSELGIANSAARLLPKGTVIVSRTASVGFSAILGVDAATTQDFVNWVCGNRIRPEYLLYVFRSMTHEFRRLTMGSTHQTIYMPDVGQFSTPVPPLEEQDAIVAHVRRESARIDALIAKIEEHVALLGEHRQALIAAAVTGQIDVREEVPR